MVNQYQKDQFKLWNDLINGTVGPPKDRRFDSDEWSKLPVFDFIKQSYLLTADALDEVNRRNPTG